MTVTTQDNSIRYHLLCIVNILSARSDDVIREYKQLIVGLAIGFVLGIIVLLPSLIISETGQAPYDIAISTVPLATTDIEIIDTELTGDASPFNFTGRFIANNEPVNTFECSFNNEPYNSCTPPVTLDNIPQGNYTFEVRSVLANGTVDPTPAASIWSVN